MKRALLFFNEYAMWRLTLAGLTKPVAAEVSK
jgi:hypothetical protein